MIEAVTDIIALHMLEVFSLIDFTIDEPEDPDLPINESFREKSDVELESIGKEERLIRELNMELDSENEIGEGIRYSRALFQQRPRQYQILLSDFRVEKQMENS
ncbi:MAG: hypothetical protein GKR96_04450 [Gammaproteobacteria bacterium]|nr:hypothetical protein [Gammaproteobacteria bacterium]